MTARYTGTMRKGDEPGTIVASLCTSCHLWHAPPSCAHHMDTPCLGCGLPVGPRFSADDGTAAGDGVMCFRCWWRYA